MPFNDKNSPPNPTLPESGAANEVVAPAPESIESGPPPMKLWPWALTLIGIAAVLSIALPPSPIEITHWGRQIANVSRIKADMRTLATALEAYYVDNQAYPPCAKGAQGVNGFLKPDDPAYSIYTFAMRPAADGKASSPYLTTPVAYITSLPKDPLALSRGASYGYYCQKTGWILFSCGPDGVYDLMEPEKVYDYHIAQPTLRLITEFSYDPTNGAGSSGDVFRCKQ